MLEMTARKPHNAVAISAAKIVSYMSSRRARHANCLRSYRRLYDSDKAAAAGIFHTCVRS